MHKAAMGGASQDPVNNSTHEAGVGAHLQQGPAVLSLAAQFLLEDTDSESDKPLQQVDDNIFEDIMVHDDIFYGEDGEEILFSVGQNTFDEESLADSEMRIWQEMDTLNYYDHSYLAQLLGDEPEDITIPRSIAALEALGKLHQHLREVNTHNTIQGWMIPNRMTQEASLMKIRRWL